MFANHKNSILMGDFNGKNKLWGSPCNDGRGRVIETFLESNDMVCLNKGDPTHINYNGTLSHLDLAICSNTLAFNADCSVMDETWGSDHFPLAIVFNECIPIINNTIEHKFNFDKANWELFKSLIHKSTIFKDKVEDLQSEYDKFVSLFLLTRDQVIPKKNKKHAMKTLKKITVSLI